MFLAELSLFFHGLLFWVDSVSFKKVVRSSTSNRFLVPLEDYTAAEILTHTKGHKKRGKLLPYFHSFRLEEDQQVISFSTNPVPILWLN